MRISLFEKVCLNLLGGGGGFAFGFLIYAFTQSNFLAWCGVAAGVAFGNWAWIDLQYGRR